MSLQNSINKANPNILSTQNYNATTGDYLIIANTSTSSPTITLPASPITGQTYKVIDGSGNAATFPVFFNGNGRLINGNSSVSPPSIPLSGGSLTNIAITPDGSFAYASHGGGGTTVSVISNASGNPLVGTPITVGSNPYGIAITPNGQYAYVCNSGSGTISIIPNASGGGGTPTSLTVGDGPIAIAITPDGNYAYVSNNNTTTVSVISGVSSGSPSVSGTLTGFNAPDGIAITPDGNYAYVCNHGLGGTISIIPNASGGGGTPTSLTVGPRPRFIAITPDGNYAYVCDSSDQDIRVISGASTSGPFIMFAPLSVKSDSGIAITPNGEKVYIGASVIYGVSSTPFVSPYNLPFNAQYIAITPNGQYIYYTVGSSTLFIANSNVISINQNYGELDLIYTGSQWLANGNFIQQ